MKNEYYYLSDNERLRYLKKLAEKEKRPKYKSALQDAVELFQEKNPCAGCKNYKINRNEMPCLKCIRNLENKE